jgi:hypothetical protein
LSALFEHQDVLEFEVVSRTGEVASQEWASERKCASKKRFNHLFIDYILVSSIGIREGRKPSNKITREKASDKITQIKR